MKRERLKRIEAKMEPHPLICIFFEETDDPPTAIMCQHQGREIPRSECPNLNGKDCPHSERLIHIVWDMVDGDGPDDVQNELESQHDHIESES